MPRTKEQNEVIRRERREAILRGALKVYAEHGYAAAEIGDIAKEAKVARGLIYYYFKDKLTLFRELFHYMHELSRSTIDSHFKVEEADVRSQLETYILKTYDSMLDHPEYVTFFMRMRHDLHAIFTVEELKDWKWYKDNMKSVAEALRRGMAAGQIRVMDPDLLMSMFWGAIMHGMVHGRQKADALKSEGKSQAEIAAAVRPELRNAAAVCMDMVIPRERPPGEAGTSLVNGDDKA